MKEFDFNKQYLVCVDACKPTFLTHPNRVVQSERLGVADAPPFKDVLFYCSDRNNALGEGKLQCVVMDRRNPHHRVCVGPRGPHLC